jgi:hypothetical protein
MTAAFSFVLFLFFVTLAILCFIESQRPEPDAVLPFFIGILSFAGAALCVAIFVRSLA